jgi:hypothetical protein
LGFNYKHFSAVIILCRRKLVRLLLSKRHGLLVIYVHNLRIFVISFDPSLILELTRVDTTRTVVSNTLAYYVSESFSTQARACFVVAPGDDEKKRCTKMSADARRNGRECRQRPVLVERRRRPPPGRR